MLVKSHSKAAECMYTPSAWFYSSASQSFFFFNHELPTAVFLFNILFCSFLASFCLDAKESDIGTGLAKTGKCLEVLLLRNDPGCLLVDILHGHDQSCQLGGQLEFFNGTLSLLAVQGLPGEEDELGAVLLQLLQVILEGCVPPSSKLKEYIFSGCQPSLTPPR